jgi:hypothetical protein
VSVQDRCTVCTERTIGSEIILDVPDSTPKWMLVSVYLEIVLILTQDKCTVCVKRTIDTKIILEAPDGSSR